jgi:beta-RFAP synthase
MIRITTGSRLHFGLLSLPGELGEPSHWPDREGMPRLPARHFGGVGVMVDGPGTELTAAPAAAWSAEGPGAERALAFGQRLCAALHIHQPFRIVVRRCAPEHVGLGTGTQLALAVGYAIAQQTGHDKLDAVALAPLVGRGQRSALGVLGFHVGGFLVEGGKRARGEVAPVVARADLPWCVVTVTPAGLQGDHGPRELEAFRQLARTQRDLQRTDALCRLVLLGMLPAAREEDLNAFGEAVYDYNRRVGEMFAPWQGGLYAHSRVADIVAAVRRLGVTGVGQSSWGPTVFAVVAGVEQGQELVAGLKRTCIIADGEWMISTIGGGAIVQR